LWFRGVISSLAPQRGACDPQFRAFALSWRSWRATPKRKPR